MDDVSPLEWAVRPIRKYADFTGRAPRAEYWWYALLASVVGLAIGLTDFVSFNPVAGNYRPLTILFTLGLLIPGLAVTIRRLHDTGRSAWWCLLKLGSYSWLLRGASAESMAMYQNLPVLLRIVSTIVAISCGLTILVFMLTRGTEGPNRFGPDLYGPDSLEEVFA